MDSFLFIREENIQKEKMGEVWVPPEFLMAEEAMKSRNENPS